MHKNIAKSVTGSGLTEQYCTRMCIPSLLIVALIRNLDQGSSWIFARFLKHEKPRAWFLADLEQGTVY